MFFVNHHPTVQLKLPNGDNRPLSILSNQPQPFPQSQGNPPPGDVYNNLMTYLDNSISKLEQYESKVNREQEKLKGRTEDTRMGQNSLFDDLPPLDDPDEQFKQLIRVKRDFGTSDAVVEVYQNSTTSMDNINPNNIPRIYNEEINQTVTTLTHMDNEHKRQKGSNSTNPELEPYENDDRFMSTVEEMIELIDQQLKNKTKNILKRIARQENIPVSQENTETSTLVTDMTNSTHTETTTIALLEKITINATLEEKSTRLNILPENSTNKSNNVILQGATLQEISTRNDILQENSTSSTTLLGNSTNNGTLQENSSSSTSLLGNSTEDDTLQENSTSPFTLPGNSTNNGILQENSTISNTEHGTDTAVSQENSTSIVNLSELYTTTHIVFLPEYVTKNILQENGTTNATVPKNITHFEFTTSADLQRPKFENNEALNTTEISTTRTIDPLKESKENIILSQTDSNKTTTTSLSDHQKQFASRKTKANKLSDHKDVYTESDVKVFIRSTDMNESDYDEEEDDTDEQTGSENIKETEPNIISVAFNNSTKQPDMSTEMVEPASNQVETDENWINSNKSTISNMTTSYLMTANATTNNATNVKLNEFYIKQRVPVYSILNKLLLKPFNSTPTQNREPLKSGAKEFKNMENVQTVNEVEQIQRKGKFNRSHYWK
uniref:Uncharacterized protein n=1 Tax=Cacopsylla melanoneura TaxID=428564 RepID=A0A8D8M7Q6_9HEMI